MARTHFLTGLLLGPDFTSLRNGPLTKGVLSFVKSSHEKGRAKKFISLPSSRLRLLERVSDVTSGSPCEKSPSRSAQPRVRCA
eukprot:1354030-Prymnesium_polylepis.1